MSRSQSSHSLASFRLIRKRMTRSRLPSASFASMQFAATEPEARTTCLTSSILEIVRGNVRTKYLMFPANAAVLSSRSFGFSPMESVWSLAIGVWIFQAFVFISCATRCTSLSACRIFRRPTVSSIAAAQEDDVRPDQKTGLIQPGTLCLSPIGLLWSLAPGIWSLDLGTCYLLLVTLFFSAAPPLAAHPCRRGRKG
jgi:hypothetical protein